MFRHDIANMTGKRLKYNPSSYPNIDVKYEVVLRIEKKLKRVCMHIAFEVSY